MKHKKQAKTPSVGDGSPPKKKNAGSQSPEHSNPEQPASNEEYRIENDDNLTTDRQEDSSDQDNS